ncbi:MAG TPA: suppressor of fused domain protein [Myxococcota bacterium]|nr:suppressor of fused domain protein [Myxococcota bacterium]HRY94481.1 suppressor of fused domain protein [Myxococcota bacterium]HSA20071.1 suppressor of fused domain protein [Myxococcota bacterium]
MARASKGDKDAKRYVAALAKLLGAVPGEALRSEPPLGEGGGADVATLSGYHGGLAHVTLGLVGSAQPAQEGGGQVELMLCTEGPAAWAPALLSALGRQSLGSTFVPGQVIDLPALPGSKLTGLLFTSFGMPADAFEHAGARGRLLLAIGLAASEVESCRKVGAELVAQTLHDDGVFPFTDLRRRGVAHPQKMRKLVPAAAPAPKPEDDLERRSALLVESLLDEGALEPVNQRARVSLASKLADLLQGLPDDPGPAALAKASAAVLDLLVDAPEVAEVFADEPQVSALLKALWSPHC